MGDLSSDQSELYLGHGLVSKFQHKLHDDQREVSETVIKFIILSVKLDQEYYSSGLGQRLAGLEK